jgi:polysaccharide transporter, PST family
VTPFDADGTFRPAKDSALRHLAVRSAGATVFSSGAMLVMQTGSTVILARVLSPADFGLVAMVTTFSLLFMNFGLNGFTEAVLQSDEIDHSLASNLFWLNFVIGLVFTIGFAAAGSLLAKFYAEPRVARVAVGLSFTILTTSISVLHLALLKRAMLYSWASAIDIIARAVAIAVSVFLGYAGWGYWSLVAGTISQTLTTSIGAWYLCRWIPGRPRHLPGTSALVRFALNVYGRFAVNYFARNTDNLLVGWRFSASALGFYKKAYDLFALSVAQLVSPLTTVAVSALSRFNRDFVKYKRYLLTTLGFMAFVGMGLGADLTLVGKDVIRVMLGPGWEEAGRIFTVFGPGIGVMLLYNTHGWIHLSIGRADRWFRWGILEFVVTSLLFIAGLPWGPVGIAAAWTVSFWLLTIPAFWYAGKPINLNATTVLATVWKYLIASVVAGCASSLIIREIQPVMSTPGLAGAISRVVVISLIFAVFYLGMVVLLHQGCAPLSQFAGLLKEMAPWTRLSRSSSEPPAICPSSQSAPLSLSELGR